MMPGKTPNFQVGDRTWSYPGFLVEKEKTTLNRACFIIYKKNVAPFFSSRVQAFPCEFSQICNVVEHDKVEVPCKCSSVRMLLFRIKALADL